MTTVSLSINIVLPQTIPQITIQWPSTNFPAGTIYTINNATTGGFQIKQNPFYPNGYTQIHNMYTTISMPLPLPNGVPAFKEGDIIRYTLPFVEGNQWAILKVLAFNEYLGYKVEIVKGNIQIGNGILGTFLPPDLLEQYGVIHVPKYHNLWLAMNKDED